MTVNTVLESQSDQCTINMEDGSGPEQTSQKDTLFQKFTSKLVWTICLTSSIRED